MSDGGDDVRETIEVLLNGNEVAHIANMDGTGDNHHSLNDHHPSNQTTDHTAQEHVYHVSNINHNLKYLPEQDGDENKSWYDHFLQLQNLSSHGAIHLLPGTNPELEQWIEHQRYMYQEMKKGNPTELSQERKVLLDTLGIEWESLVGHHPMPNAVDSNVALDDIPKFNEKCRALMDFKEMYGHSNVPVDYKEGPELGKWVSQQRELFDNGLLPYDRVSILSQLGFDFSSSNKSTISFEQRIQQVISFKNMYGHTKIPRGWSHDASLHDWVLEQKQLMQRYLSGEQYLLSQQQYKELLDADIDFDFYEPEMNNLAIIGASVGSVPRNELNRTHQWDAMYQELREYKMIHGHTNVPRRSKRDPSKDELGEWVHFQKRQHRNLFTGKKSTLTIARKKALDIIGFQWEKANTSYSTEVNTAIDHIFQSITEKAYNDQWYEYFAQLESHVTKHQTSHVDFRSNPLLAVWVQRQRLYYKLWKESLASDHIHESIRFDQEKYQRLMSVHFDFSDPADFNDGMNNPQMISDDPDYVEIFGGIEDCPVSVAISQDSHLPNQDLTHSQSDHTENHERELNETDVHMILVGDREVDRIHNEQRISHQLPIPNVGAHDYINEMPEEHSDPTHLRPHHNAQMEHHNIHHSMDQGRLLQMNQNVVTQRRVMIKVRVDWEERVLELFQFKARKNHTNVPTKWKTNPELADWFWRQQLQYLRFIQNQPSSLNRRKFEIFLDLGFEFIAKDATSQTSHGNDSDILAMLEATAATSCGANKVRPCESSGRFKEAKWLESFAKVVRYKEKHGHCNVPRKWKEDLTLGEWVHFQRRQYRLRQLGKRNHMTNDRVERLNLIGFEWSRGSSNVSTMRDFVRNNKMSEVDDILLPSVAENDVINQIDNREYSYTVPTDVSQLLDNDDKEKAAEIAAVVAESLNHDDSIHSREQKDNITADSVQV
jgi:hypothetical protein